MTFPMAMDTIVALAVDRLYAVALPAGAEPSPMEDGGTPAEWAGAGGLACRPHELIAGRFPDPLDLGPYDAETVAHTALQRLVQRGTVDRLPGLPMRYRPRPDAKRPERRRRRRS